MSPSEVICALLSDQSLGRIALGMVTASGVFLAVMVPLLLSLLERVVTLRTRGGAPETAAAALELRSLLSTHRAKLPQEVIKPDALEALQRTLGQVAFSQVGGTVAAATVFDWGKQGEIHQIAESLFASGEPAKVELATRLLLNLRRSEQTPSADFQAALLLRFVRSTIVATSVAGILLVYNLILAIAAEIRWGGGIDDRVNLWLVIVPAVLLVGLVLALSLYLGTMGRLAWTRTTEDFVKVLYP